MPVPYLRRPGAYCFDNRRNEPEASGSMQDDQILCMHSYRTGFCRHGHSMKGLSRRNERRPFL
jgi:hypothetical protein